jgi:hypothetical protein
MNAKIRAPATTSIATPEPAAHDVPPPLNLDLAGNPLTYQSAMAGPDKGKWEIAGGDEITRLIESLTAIPIHKTKIPSHKWRDIVYYNPVARQNLSKDGKIEYRVRGTAGGNLLTVTYDVSARTANLEVVKILIHATCSSKRKWMTIDIKDFYLGTPLTPGQYEYMRIHQSKIPAAPTGSTTLAPAPRQLLLLLLRDSEMPLRSPSVWQAISGPPRLSPRQARIYPEP